MKELGFDIQQALGWFTQKQATPYVLVEVSDAHAQGWASALGLPVRRCYVTDSLLEERALRTGESRATLVAANLPDPGPTMSGDFGEILVYVYHAAQHHPNVPFGPKKWRLKEDRTKAAKGSDVVQFILPTWPTPSSQDVLLCSEAKMKATDNKQWHPITKAIEGCEKDRTSRLASTLVWLRERALMEDLGEVQLVHLKRFINAVDYPPAQKRYFAVAIVCESLLAGELADAPKTSPADYTVVVISVPEFHNVYNLVFEAVHLTAAATAAATTSGSR